MSFSGLNIGILGGGQLARMMIESTNQYAFNYIIYSQKKNSPAGRVAYKEFCGLWNEFNILDEFLNECDLITLENEFIDYKIIRHIEEKGKTVLPDSNTVKLIQDKLFQKNALTNLSIPTAKYSEIDNESAVLNFVNELSYPVILKSRTMGYDGKGNYRIDSEKEVTYGYNLLSERGQLMIEEFIPFKKELAIQVVKSLTGEIKFYPLVETIQKNHICHLVFAPFQDEKIITDAKSIAQKIVNELNYSGVMGIEFFLTEENALFVNELAPRVHNTGHYSIEGCFTSQFENHIRAVLGLPLGSTEMKQPYSVMINVLGSRDGLQELNGFEDILKLENTYFHNYGKDETRVGRKMGHITVTGKSHEECYQKAILSSELIQI